MFITRVVKQNIVKKTFGPVFFFPPEPPFHRVARRARTAPRGSRIIDRLLGRVRAGSRAIGDPYRSTVVTTLPPSGGAKSA